MTLLFSVIFGILVESFVLINSSGLKNRQKQLYCMVLKWDSMDWLSMILDNNGKCIILDRISQRLTSLKLLLLKEERSPPQHLTIIKLETLWPFIMFKAWSMWTQMQDLSLLSIKTTFWLKIQEISDNI